MSGRQFTVDRQLGITEKCGCKRQVRRCHPLLTRGPGLLVTRDSSALSPSPRTVRPPECVLPLPVRCTGRQSLDSDASRFGQLQLEVVKFLIDHGGDVTALDIMTPPCCIYY